MNAHFLDKRIAHALGFAGLIPFVALALGCAFADAGILADIVNSQRAYGIAILSFLCGIHWGAAMVTSTLSMAQTRKAMFWGVTPSLIAWLSTMAGGFGFAVLMIGFIAAYQADRRLFVWYRMPAWFIRLRLILTCVVVGTLMLTVILVNARM